MKKNYQHDKAASRGQTATAALLIGSALGLLAGPLHAQESTGPAAAPQLAITKPAMPPAESVRTPQVQVFQTSPSLRQATLSAVAPAPAAAPEKGVPASTASGAAALSQLQEDANIPWILDSNNRPWPLTYLELLPVNTLVLNLPGERDARTMLPGAVSDSADRARFVINRYITDNIGAAAQMRGRQLETINVWLDGLQRQKLGLPKDPWAAYQFSIEAHEKLASFKAKVASQTEPTVQRMATDINAAVAQITPVMAVMGSYEQQLQWYNVLVQLKEGLSLYQTRALEADRQILEVVAGFERDNPPVSRPVGRVPVQPGTPGSVPAAQAEQPTSAASMTPAVQREAAQAPSARQEPSGLSGSVVLLAVGALIIGFFVMLRRRVASKARAGKSAAD
jgi:hypothetical protein